MKQVLNFWSIDTESLILLVLLCAYFLYLKNARKLFVSIALLLFVACFFSPLRVLSEHYLFSAHMTVHVLLLLCMGPLLVLALSSRTQQLDSLFGFLKQHPVAAWLTGVGMMWFWHVPVLFNSAMAHMHDGGVHWLSLVEALSLLIAGMVFSAPVLHPNKRYRTDALKGVVYLFTACIGCSLLGLLITFAPAGTYRHFLSMYDMYGLNTVITSEWGLTQTIDQQAAGLIMWVPCCLVYVSGAMYLLVHWFRQREEVSVYTKQL